jgi:hypothetical protein
MTTHSHHRTQCSLPRRSTRRRCPRLRPRAPLPRCQYATAATLHPRAISTPPLHPAQLCRRVPLARPRQVAPLDRHRAPHRRFVLHMGGSRPAAPADQVTCLHARVAACTSYPDHHAILVSARASLPQTSVILSSASSVHTFPSKFCVNGNTSTSTHPAHLVDSSSAVRVTSRWDCGLDSAIRVTCVMLGLWDSSLHRF